MTRKMPFFLILGKVYEISRKILEEMTTESKVTFLELSPEEFFGIVEESPAEFVGEWLKELYIDFR